MGNFYGFAADHWGQSVSLCLALFVLVGCIYQMHANRTELRRRVKQRRFEFLRQIAQNKLSSPKAFQQLSSISAGDAIGILRAQNLWSTPIVPRAQSSEAPGIVPGRFDIADVQGALWVSILERRSKLLAEIEQSRGSRVIAFVHGVPRNYDGQRAHTHFDLDTADEVLSALRGMDSTAPLDIILHTPGGEMYPGFQIARAIKAHRGKKTVFIPFHAYSLGTILALVADKIVMGEHAVLGPIDSQIGTWPAVDFVRLAGDKSKNELDDLTLMMSYRAERAMRESNDICDMVNSNHKRDGTCALTQRLGSGELSHAYPIDIDQARELGISVETGVPDAVYEFVELFRDVEKEPAVFHLDSP